MSKIKFPIMALLVLLSAAVLTFFNSRVKIDYCKNAVKNGEGLAVLKEESFHAAVIKLDSSGKVTDRANILLNNPFTLSVRSVHDLFSDDSGNLYVFCTVYGMNRSRYETIYKCNFVFGSAQRIWSSKQISGYTVAENGTPYIDEGGIYIPMLNTSSGKTDIVKFSGNNHTVISEDCDQSGFDSVFYRDGVVFCAKDTEGIFANGEKIYPLSNADGTEIYDALNYDRGFFNFIDVARNKLVHYDINARSFSEESVEISAFNKLQSLQAYSDGTVTASCEDGEYLRAYRYLAGAEETYSLVSGGFFLRSYLIFVLISAAAAALLVFLYTLLFVRKRKQKDGTVKYQSIAARITAISTAAGIICAIVFGVLINGTIKKLNVGLQNTIDTNGSQFLAGNIFSDCYIELKNGSIPRITNRYGESVTQIMDNYQAALAENNGIECYFLLLAETNGGLYHLEEQFDDSVSAEYMVSLRAADIIKNCIDTGVNCTFEDKMTSGRLQYTCTNFPIHGTDDAVFNGVLCTVSDAYRIKQTGFMLYIWMIAVIFMLVVLLLIAANIVLRYNLFGLKRLRAAFAVYEKDESGGDTTMFLIPNKNGLGDSSDEISETGHALMLMTEGIGVHTRDINEGNRKYKRFIAAGVLKLMERSEISKVNFGDHISQNALILRFFIGNGSDAAERIDTVNEFIEKAGGILLNYGGGRADICFTDESEYGRAADTAARLGFPSVILASYGRVEAGSAGSDKGAWLIALSNISEEFRRLELFDNPGTAPMVCTKNAESKLKNDKLFSRRDELRSNVLGDVEYFDIFPRELGEENERETVDNNLVGDITVDNSSLNLIS